METEERHHHHHHREGSEQRSSGHKEHYSRRHMQVKSDTHQLNTSFRIGFTSGPKNASKSRHSTNAAATAPTM